MVSLCLSLSQIMQNKLNRCILVHRLLIKQCFKIQIYGYLKWKTRINTIHSYGKWIVAAYQ